MGFQMPRLHHATALAAEAEFSVPAVYGWLSAATRLNPDAGFNAFTLQSEPVESAVTIPQGILNSLSNLAPLAVVNYGCHLIPPRLNWLRGISAPAG